MAILDYVDSTYGKISGALSGMGEGLMSLTPEEIEKRRKEKAKARLASQVAAIDEGPQMSVIEDTRPWAQVIKKASPEAPQMSKVKLADKPTSTQILESAIAGNDVSDLSLADETLETEDEGKGSGWADRMAKALSYIKTPEKKTVANKGATFNAGGYFGALQHNPFAGIGGKVK